MSTVENTVDPNEAAAKLVEIVSQKTEDPADVKSNDDKEDSGDVKQEQEQEQPQPRPQQGRGGTATTDVVSLNNIMLSAQRAPILSIVGYLEEWVGILTQYTDLHVKEARVVEEAQEKQGTLGKPAEKRAKIPITYNECVDALAALHPAFVAIASTLRYFDRVVHPNHFLGNRLEGDAKELLRTSWNAFSLREVGVVKVLRDLLKKPMFASDSLKMALDVKRRLNQNMLASDVTIKCVLGPEEVFQTAGQIPL